MSKFSDPAIFDYLSYRQYLEAKVDYLKSRGEYSIRSFAKKVGFKSSSYMKMIIMGQRALSVQTAKALAQGFQLDAEATRFLILLVELEAAPTVEDQEEILRKILLIQRKKKRRRLAAERLKILSQWYVPVILESILSSAKKWPASKFSQALGISMQKVEETFDLLLNLGLIAKDPETGHWRRLDESLDTDPVIDNFPVREFHSQMLQQSKRALETHDKSKIDLGALTVCLTKQDFEKIRARLFELRSEIAAEYSASEKAEGVYQLNLQFFEFMTLKS